MFYFIGWIFKKAIAILKHSHSRHKEMLIDNDAWIIAILGAIMFVISIALFNISVIIAISNLVDADLTKYGVEAWIVAFVIPIMYIVYTWFSVMFDAYRQEQQDLLDTLKKKY